MASERFPDLTDKLFAGIDFADELAARDQAQQEEQARLFAALLEVMDGFDRLLGEVGPAVRPPRSVPLGTVRTLARQLARCLEARGVIPIPCLGEVVDPGVHEVAEVCAASGATDVIVEVLRRGYAWEGRLLRRPRVILAGPPKETRP